MSNYNIPTNFTTMGYDPTDVENYYIQDMIDNNTVLPVLLALLGYKVL